VAIAGESGILHGSFTTQMNVRATQGKVFDAYAELSLRKKWFRMPGEPDGDHQLDFRPGGAESVASTFAPIGDHREHLKYTSHFLDIVPNQRIVLAYVFELDGSARWASLVTVELSKNGSATLLRHDEQFTFFEVGGDGGDDVAHLKGGTRLQLNGLAATVGKS
jgi:uncharacterized protein YndB with AHSA1/START domain